MKIRNNAFKIFTLVLLAFALASCITENEGNTKNSETATNEVVGRDYETTEDNSVSVESEDLKIDDATKKDEEFKQEKEPNTKVVDQNTKTEPTADDKTDAANASDFFKDADKFISKNVSNGKVNYRSINGNPAELNDLVATLEKMDLKGKSKNETKAFWINAYNILTIKGIVNKYPIKQPTDVDGFFDKIKFTAAGEKLTLNDIENKKLRAKLNDARIHFVLVCGAQSCPPIINKAYTADNVNSLLETQTKKAINANYFVEVDNGAKTATVSMIMKWYKEDFVKGGQDEIAFLNKYRNDKIPADYSVKYKEYNWDLNKQ